MPFLDVVNDHIYDYPTASNLSYWWNFGSLAGITLGVQIVTGILLAMHYCPHVDLAFASVEHIMRDVNYGWLIRYTHANGASMFFIVVYIHMARGLYYGSYNAPRQFVWILGVVIFLLMMATAFMGYVLPWGQMSFWGATVITNLFSAIPVVGDSIVQLLWGGFSVDNATLNRFFSLHYLVPFLLAGLVIVHIAAVHVDGSNNPLGVPGYVDKISFTPYFYVKDAFGLLVFFSIFALVVFLAPNAMGHPDNYIPANPMVTPPHIVPEWYFLPFYAILRSIPDKLGGVLGMGGAIVLLALLPFLNTAEVRSSAFRPLHRKMFWLFAADVLLLGWIGGSPAEEPYIFVGQLATVFYFSYIIVFVPALGILERLLIRLGSVEMAESTSVQA
jgi:ubiquinol-cytochrome c reductase cytochrome b subunit